MTLAGGEYDLNNEPLRINSANQNKFNGITITGRYCPTRGRIILKTLRAAS